MVIFWIIIIVTILALLQVTYYNKRALKSVTYERRFSTNEVFAGDKLELIEILANNKLIPVPWVRVESRMSASLKFKKQENLDINMEQFHKSLFFLGPYSRITRRHEIHCLKRGYYDCSRISVVAGDLFGLSRADRDQVEEDARLYVLPQIAKADQLPDAAIKWQGEVSVRRWILPDPIFVSGIREYRSGDNRKDVHWGATARTGILQVKIRDYTVSPKVLIVFNTQISDQLFGGMNPEDVEFLEKGINICAALAAWCINMGLEVGFLSNGAAQFGQSETPVLESGSTQAHLKVLLRMLATLVIKMQTGIHTLLDRQIKDGISGMDVLIVSAYWSEDLEKRAVQFRNNGNTVTHIPIVGGGRHG
jgi:uncharacterized protein (DUF58 family)